MSARFPIPNLSTDTVEVALRQARKERTKGHHRRSMLLLRRAAFEARERPAVWAHYALSCMKSGQVDEGRKAFAHAAWLHERNGHRRRADLIRRLAAQAEAGTLPPLYS